MAKDTLSIIAISSVASCSHWASQSPAGMVGKSSAGNVGSLNRARPHLIVMPVLPSDSMHAMPSAGSFAAIDANVPASMQKVRALFDPRSEEHTSALQSLMRNSYAVFCLKKHKHTTQT